MTTNKHLALIRENGFDVRVASQRNERTRLYITRDGIDLGFVEYHSGRVAAYKIRELLEQTAEHTRRGLALADLATFVTDFQ